jgi:hypothetical protein
MHINIFTVLISIMQYVKYSHSNTVLLWINYIQLTVQDIEQRIWFLMNLELFIIWFSLFIWMSIYIFNIYLFSVSCTKKTSLLETMIGLSGSLYFYSGPYVCISSLGL